MQSSDSSWKASQEDPTFNLVLCCEDSCTRAVIGRADKEFRCGKHENEYQAWLEDNKPGRVSCPPVPQMPEIWYE